MVGVGVGGGGVGEGPGVIPAVPYTSRIVRVGLRAGLPGSSHPVRNKEKINQPVPIRIFRKGSSMGLNITSFIIREIREWGIAQVEVICGSEGCKGVLVATD